MKWLVLPEFLKLPPMQYLHPCFSWSLMSDIKTFGSVEAYFEVLKECGLWDFENDCMLEDHYESCGKLCKRHKL